MARYRNTIICMLMMGALPAYITGAAQAASSSSSSCSASSSLPAILTATVSAADAILLVNQQLAKSGSHHIQISPSGHAIDYSQKPNISIIEEYHRQVYGPDNSGVSDDGKLLMWATPQGYQLWDVQQNKPTVKVSASELPANFRYFKKLDPWIHGIGTLPTTSCHAQDVTHGKKGPGPRIRSVTLASLYLGTQSPFLHEIIQEIPINMGDNSCKLWDGSIVGHSIEEKEFPKLLRLTFPKLTPTPYTSERLKEMALTTSKLAQQKS